MVVDEDGNLTDAANGNKLYFENGNLSETNSGGAANTLSTSDNFIKSGDTTYAANGDGTGPGGTDNSFVVTGATISKEDFEKQVRNDTSQSYAVDLDDDASTTDNTVEDTLTGGTQQYVSGFDGKSFTDSASTTIYKNEDANFTDGAANEVYVKEDGSLTYDDVSDATATENPLEALDAALNQVDSFRSDLGAIQNLQTNETNLSAARSRIEDADYATEVANMTRSQILQQAGTSVLAKA